MDADNGLIIADLDQKENSENVDPDEEAAKQFGLMSVAATALHVKQNQIGGVNPTKQQCQLAQPTSKLRTEVRSPLRLFAPRSISIGNFSSSVGHCLRRRLKFTSTEELTDRINLQSMKRTHCYSRAPRNSKRENSTPVIGPQTSKSACASGTDPKAATRLSPPANRLAPNSNGMSSRKRHCSRNGADFDRECGVGLHNPLNNCFLNSVLQAVVHIPQLARMILEGRDSRMCTNQQPPNNCFHCALRNHIHRAVTQYPPLGTGWINSHLKKIFPHHRSGTQEDAHEMLTLLLGALEPFPPRKSNLKIHGTQGPGPSTSIEQIFGGSLRNRIVCNVCSQEHLNYERIREINLGLTRNYRTDINELIHDFFEPEQIQNFLCISCKQKRCATRFTSMLRAPSVLIIQLKRFNVYGGKNRLDVRPKPRMDLSRYSMKNESIIYEMNGIVEHIGGGINFGHYICAMRGFKGNWFKFDDSEKKRVSLSEVVQNMDPYILFYTKISPGNQQQRRSFGGFAPSTPKQARLNNYPHNGRTAPSKRFNNTISSFIH
uniref:Ubiquitin carboxyl-terminal hydrolase 36 n=1 Tax=Globodera rostochiensis TaxID=31243 RepID=A0A914GTW0_GLORO